MTTTLTLAKGSHVANEESILCSTGLDARGSDRGSWMVCAEGDSTVRYHEGEAFDWISFGAETALLERNSVILIPNLVTQEECGQLTRGVERAHADTKPEGADLDGDEGMERYMVSELCGQTQSIFNDIFRERLLPFIHTRLPSHIEDNIWALSMIFDREDRAPLCEQRFKFSSQEPAINRYSKFGAFEPHRDALAVTLNVLLSDGFEGGGTQFWQEGIDDLDCGRGPALCLLPSAGVGVVFNGTVKHAGREVVSGTRHLLVASFSVAR